MAEQTSSLPRPIVKVCVGYKYLGLRCVDGEEKGKVPFHVRCIRNPW